MAKRILDRIFPIKVPILQRTTEANFSNNSASLKPIWHLFQNGTYNVFG
jgi:hypothetical protein